MINQIRWSPAKTIVNSYTRTKKSLAEEVMMIQDMDPDQDQYWDRSVSKVSFVLVYLMSGPLRLSGTQLFLSTDQLTIQSWILESHTYLLQNIYIFLIFPFCSLKVYISKFLSYKMQYLFHTTFSWRHKSLIMSEGLRIYWVSKALW